MKTLLYVHGYGSDRTSRKFFALQELFSSTHNCFCLEWITNSDIPYLLNKAVEKLADTNELTIIGDSTGANLAYQIRELRNNSNDKLVLLSPLLDIDNILVDINFPQSFLNELIQVSKPENALIIASKNDEVINQNSLFGSQNNSIEIMDVDDNHRLENFNDYLPRIADYVTFVK